MFVSCESNGLVTSMNDDLAYWEGQVKFENHCQQLKRTRTPLYLCQAGATSCIMSCHATVTRGYTSSVEKS
jgi:hypothetical protein